MSSRRYPPLPLPLFNRWLIERIRSFRCGTHACLRPSSVPFINGEKRREFRNYSLRTVSARCNNECLSHIRGKKQSSGRREGRRVLWDGEDEDKEKEEYDSSAFCRPLQEESMSAYRKTWWIARIHPKCLRLLPSSLCFARSDHQGSCRFTDWTRRVLFITLTR